MISGCPDLTGVPPNETGLDPSFIELLKAVGKKLYEMDLNSSSSSVAAEREVAPTPKHHPTTQVDPPTLESVAMDPIEKVEQWQQGDLRLASPSKEVPPSATSCYGSLPPSPTIETSTPFKGSSHQHPLTAISPTPFEQDSGYPGSDRSAMRLQMFSLHKQGSTSSSYSGGRKNMILSNVEEERAAAAAAMNPRKETSGLAVGSSCVEKKAASMHTTYLNSVTDLSSDERSMFEVKGVGEEDQDEITEERYPIVPEKYLHPQRPAGGRGGAPMKRQQQQPMILATQIDQEIMELRNFFEDHREEMMTLIHDNSQELVFPPIGSITPRKKQRLKARKSEIERMMSAESGTDFEIERRQEFEKRRRIKKRLTHPQNAGPITPEFILGQTQQQQQHLHSPHQQPQQEEQHQKISAFFPNVDPSLGSTAAYSSRLGGTEVDSAQGPIFIPKLPLDDLWTEKSGDERLRDPRSFDFNQSLVSIPSLAQTEEAPPARQEQQRPKTCERTKRAPTNPEDDVYYHQGHSQMRSQSVADLLHQNTTNSPPNVVIVHSCCRHSTTDRSEKNCCHSSTNRGRKSSCSNSHHSSAKGSKSRSSSSKNKKRSQAKKVRTCE